MAKFECSLEHLHSMSSKDRCWDNACAESFFHSLKVEAVLYEPIMDRETMRQSVFKYIEVDTIRLEGIVLLTILALIILN